jgi:hypothetical protein
MIKFKFVFENRRFPRRAQKWSDFDPDRFAGQQGLYLLRDNNRTPLFVDRTLDLGARFMQHARCKGFAKTVRDVLVIPPDDLPSAGYQDGFKVDLVRRYDPRLNVNLVGIVEAIAI